MVTEYAQHPHWKKALALVCSLALLAPLLVQVPGAQALPGEEERDLVVLLVEESLFDMGNPEGEDLSSAIYQYARDVQNALPQTQTLILTVRPEEDAGDIFAVLEKLYLDGQVTSGIRYQLSGVVAIGDINLPILRGDFGDLHSIFPWTDFEDPAFLWEEEQGVFIENSGSASMQADIFHGVIRAPFSDIKSEEEWLISYFEKNHAYHTGELDEAEQSIFFADLSAEQMSVHPIKLAQYEARQDYAEDFAFLRFNKSLLREVQGRYFDIAEEDEIFANAPQEILDFVSDAQVQAEAMDIPDSMTRDLILESLPSYARIAETYLTDAEDVLKPSGRYFFDEDRVDTFPLMITAMDALTAEYLKMATLQIEEDLTTYTEASWQEPVTIPVTYNYHNIGADSTETRPVYYNGLLASDMSSAEQCSLLRGSLSTGFGDQSQMSEMNLLGNVFADIDYRDQCRSYGYCCPMYLQEPDRCDPKLATKPVFDLAGGMEQEEGELASYRDCFSLPYTESIISGLMTTVTPDSLEETKEISSVVVHNEPRLETIAAALQNGVSRDIPADEYRHFTFQGPGFSFHEIAFPDLFGLEPSEHDYLLTKEELRSFLESYEHSIREQILRSAFESYLAYSTANARGLRSEGAQLLPASDEDMRSRFLVFQQESTQLLRSTFPEARGDLEAWELFLSGEGGSELRSQVERLWSEDTSFYEFMVMGGGVAPRRNIMMISEDGEAAPTHYFRAPQIPKKGFLLGEDPEMPATFDLNALSLALLWQYLDAHEKHQILLQMQYGGIFENPFLPQEQPYELGYFRGRGDQSTLYWGDASLSLELSDPTWEEWQSETEEEDPYTDEVDPCTGAPYSEGVSVLEWPAAFACWLENIEMEVDYSSDLCEASTDTVFDWESEETFEELWSLPVDDPAIPGGISIESNHGDAVPVGTEVTLALRFFDDAGQLYNETLAYSIPSSSGLRLLQEGETLFAQGGLGYVRLVVEEEGASLQIAADGFPTTSYDFLVLDAPELQIERLASEGLNHHLQISAEDGYGELLSDYSGEVSLSLAAPGLGKVFPQQVTLEQGRAEAVVSLASHTPNTLFAASDGFASAELSFGAPADSTVLSFLERPHYVPVNGSTTIEFAASEEVTLEMTPSSEGYARITDLRDGVFELTGQGKMGTVFLRASAGGQEMLFSLPVLLPFLQSEELLSEQFVPQGQAAALLGGPFADFGTAETPLANALLFSGQQQAVLSTVHAPLFRQPDVSVFADGTLTGSQQLESHLSSYDPPTISVREGLSKREVLRYSLRYLEGASFTTYDPLESYTTPSMALESGTAALTFTSAGEFTSISLGGDEVLRVFPKGNMLVLDPRLILEPLLSGDHVRFLLRFDGEELGLLHFFHPYLEVLRHSGQEITPFAREGNENGHLGFSLFLDEEESLFRPFATGLGDELGAGFSSQDNVLSQLAAARNIGLSLQGNAGPLDLLLGDPTFALQPSEEQVSGFDRSIGSELLRSSARDINDITLFDFNADGYDDIAVLSDHHVQILQNMGGLSFRDLGDQVVSGDRFSEISSAASSDAFDDLYLQTRDGQLRLYENLRETFYEQEELSLPSEGILQMEVRDMDRDGTLDVVAYKETGELLVFWGAEDGYAEDRMTLLDQFGPEVDTSNLAEDNTLLSYPGIEDSMTSYPLPLLGAYTQEMGISLVPLEGGDDLEYLEDYVDAGTLPSGNATVGLFAPLPPNMLDVSLTLADDNRGIVAKDDLVTYTLTVRNTGLTEDRFSLAFALDPSLSLLTNTLTSSNAEAVLPVFDILSGSEAVKMVGFSVPIGQSETFTFQARMLGEVPLDFVLYEDLASDVHPADGLPDVGVYIRGMAGVLYYFGQSSRTFVRSLDTNEEVALPEYLEVMRDEDGDGVFDAIEGKETEFAESYADDYFGSFRTDSDGDGLIDAWDTLASPSSDGSDPGWIREADRLGELGNEVMSYTQCDGGCLNIPINFAFLVPGTVNVFEMLMSSVGGTMSASADTSALGAGADLSGVPVVGGFAQSISNGLTQIGSAIADLTSGITDMITSAQESLQELINGVGIPGGVIPYGVPVFGTLINFPFVCTGPSCNVTSSHFRFYLSPTLTGATGVVICNGSFNPNVPTSACFVFAPSALNVSSLCDASARTKSVSQPATAVNGSCSAQASQSSGAFITEKDVGGPRGLLFDLADLGSFSYSYEINDNKRTSLFPWNWVEAQLNEFLAMLSLPDIIVYYPDIMDVDFDKTVEKYKGDLSSDASAAFDAASALTSDLNPFGDEEDATSLGLSDLYTVLQHEETWADRMDVLDMEMEQTQETFAEDLQDLQKKSDAVATSMEELFQTIDDFPLLELDVVSVDLRLPYASEAYLLTMIADWTRWAENARAEVQRAKEQWFACDNNADMSSADCDLQKALAEKILVDADALIASVEQNIAILKTYLEIPRFVAHVDGMAAEWIDQVICYVDNALLFLPDWYLRNKHRMEQYIEFQQSLEHIKDAWEKIKHLFDDYEAYCQTCTSGKGSMTLFYYQLIAQVIPTPPIVEFPRLPDVVLDFSQIKAQIVLPVPEVQIHFQPLLLPNLPPLSLPDAPSANVQIPEFELLPPLPPLPEMPTLPPVPVIKLPDLPPVPRLPDVVSELASLTDVIRPLLFVYCMYKWSGAWPHFEMTEVKAVLEDITARSSTHMLDIDLAASMPPNIRLPSVKEIIVEAQVNLDLGEDVAEELRETYEDFEDDWSDMENDLRGTWQEGVYEFEGSMREGLELPFEYDGEEVDLDVEDLSFLKHFQDLRLDAPVEELDTTAFLRSVGEDPVVLPDVPPGVPALETLRTQLAFARDELEEERDFLLAGGEITQLSDRTVSMGALTSKVTFSQGTKLLASNVSAGRVPLDDPDPVLTQPEDSVTLECTDGGEEILFDPSLASNINNLLSSDLDRDGDMDLLYFDDTRLLVKENRTSEGDAPTITDAPRMATLASLLPAREAPKNLSVSSSSRGTTVSFLPRQLGADTLGVEILLYPRSGAHYRDTDEQPWRVLLTADEYLPGGQEQDTFVDQTVFLGPHSFTGPSLVRRFDEMRVTFPAFTDGFSHLRVRMIAADGFSTGSERKILRTERQNDTLEPLVVFQDEEILVFEDIDLNELLVASLDEGDVDITPEEDVDGLEEQEDGRYTFLPPEPGSYDIPILITDEEGNVTRETVTIEASVPELLLYEDALRIGRVIGRTDPRTPELPVAIYRTRNGETTQLQTPSANADGLFLTDEDGAYFIDDFTFSSSAALRVDGEELLSFDAEEAAFQLSDALSLLPSTDASLLLADADGNILGKLTYVLDGTSDVRVMRQELRPELLASLPSGVYVRDVHPSDSSIHSLLSHESATLPGGVLFSGNGGVFGALSRFGALSLDEHFSVQALDVYPNTVLPLFGIFDADGVLLFEFAFVLQDPELSTLPQKFTPAPASSFSYDVAVPETSTSSSFSDLRPDHPYYQAITSLQEKGVVEGYGDGTFRPDQRLSRAEFVKLVLAAADCTDCTSQLPEELDPPFPDTPAGAWYLFCLSLAKSIGYVEGYGDGLFRPDQSISRAESVAVLLRAAGIAPSSDDTPLLTDIPAGAWYQEEVRSAVALGLLTPVYGMVFPEEPVTRGEFAFMAEQVLSLQACSSPSVPDPGVTHDACPSLPEDLDGDRDRDGCPDWEGETEHPFVLRDAFTETLFDEDPVSDMTEDVSSSEDITTSEDSSLEDTELTDLGDTLFSDDTTGEVPTSSQDFSLPSGIYFSPASGAPSLTHDSDMQAGDILFTAITSPDGEKILTESEHYEIPASFSPPE